MDFSADFYATAAQVIVVLFLLIAVEMRVLVRQDEKGGSGARRLPDRAFMLAAFIAVGLIATTAIGIAASLVALYEEQSTTVRCVEVVATLIVEGFLVLSLPAIGVGLTMAEQEVSDLTKTAKQYGAAVDAMEGAVAEAKTSGDWGPVQEAIDKSRALGKQTQRAARPTWLVATIVLLWACCVAVAAVPLYATAALFS
ncbi:MAG: hypothetical protein QOE69_1067 [Thermoleophilaceae bacterium]|jgi:hypothetical protein|nr:hypothetical protein [Thermoleophilaceae bacterium]